MEQFTDTYALVPELQAQLAQLIRDCPEFLHLQRAKVPVVLSQRALIERARAVPVSVQHGAIYEGQNSVARQFNSWLRAMWVKDLCEGTDPDFLILIDVALWPKDALRQEQLLYHACCHIEQKENEYGVPKFHDDGRPMLRMRPHDIERFDKELERYGAVLDGFADEAGKYAGARQRALKWQPRAS